MAENKIYFWLKLKKDFFKRHDIRIIENMENGKEFILFYLKLLCESVDHDGNLRFSESIPYTVDMLASITNTKKDIVAEALKVFEQLELLEIQNDGTFYMTKVPKMIGSETDWARKKRDFRQKKQDDEDNERTNEGQVEDITRTNEGQKKTLSDKSKSKSKSIEKELEIELESKEEVKEENAAEAAHASTPPKPTKHSFGEYKHVKLTDEEHRRLIEQYGEDDTAEAVRILDEYIEEKGYKTKNHYLTMKKWVFNAVNERRGKRTASGSPQNKTAQQLGEFYAMAQSWAERGD